MKALFIGGPWDGRLLEPSLTQPTFHVAERRSLHLDYVVSPSSKTVITQVAYVRLSLLGYDFMIEQSVYERGMALKKHPAEIIADLLCQGYRRPSNIFGDI